MEDGFEKASAFGLGDRKLRFQSVAHRHQLVDLGAREGKGHYFSDFAGFDHPRLLGLHSLHQLECRLIAGILLHEPPAHGKVDNLQSFGVTERLLNAVSDAAVVVLGLDDGNRDVTSFPRTMMRPFVKLTSSRSCVVSSHPARRSEGVMNLVQMSVR